MRRIETEADLAEGLAALAAMEPRFAEALSMTGPPPLRRRPGGFAALLMIIVEQQVSVAAGRAIWARVEAAGATSADAVLAMDAEALRGLGLSRPKAKAAHALAEAVLQGALCFQRQDAAAYEAAFDEMVAVKGVGPWTAEIYHLACVGRADLMPASDIALREAARRLFDLPERPDARSLAAMAQAWSPWRSVAARLLWAYYRVATGRGTADGAREMGAQAE